MNIEEALNYNWSQYRVTDCTEAIRVLQFSYRALQAKHKMLLDRTNALDAEVEKLTTQLAEYLKLRIDCEDAILKKLANGTVVAMSNLRMECMEVTSDYTSERFNSVLNKLIGENVIEVCGSNGFKLK